MNRHQRRASKYANGGKHSLGKQAKKHKSRSPGWTTYVQRKQALHNERIIVYLESEYYAILHGEIGG